MKQCNVCKADVAAFEKLGDYYERMFERHHARFKLGDYETLNVAEYRCPKCGASDRDRLYVLFYERTQAENAGIAPRSILDIAPAVSLSHYLRHAAKVLYRSADSLANRRPPPRK